jgi:hypothetical protein
VVVRWMMMTKIPVTAAVRLVFMKAVADCASMEDLVIASDVM